MSKENAEAQNDSGTELEIIEAEDGGEIIADGGTQQMKTPRETQETIEGIGGRAKASTSWENTLEVTGTVGFDNEPSVDMVLGDEGQVPEASIVLSFDPDEARELAEMLQRKADYAEEYAVHRRDQEE